MIFGNSPATGRAGFERKGPPGFGRWSCVLVFAGDPALGEDGK
jgi:hypothetical protein